MSKQENLEKDLEHHARDHEPLTLMQRVYYESLIHVAKRLSSRQSDDIIFSLKTGTVTKKNFSRYDIIITSDKSRVVKVHQSEHSDLNHFKVYISLEDLMFYDDSIEPAKLWEIISYRIPAVSWILQMPEYDIHPDGIIISKEAYSTFVHEKILSRVVGDEVVRMKALKILNL